MKRMFCICFSTFYMAFMCSCSPVIASDVKNRNDLKNKYFFGTTNIKISNPKDITSTTYDLSVPTRNYMIKKEKEGQWIQGIQGIVFTPVAWSHETTFYRPSTTRRNNSIISGNFVEYTGSEKWRWSVKKAEETEVGKGGLLNREQDPSFVVTFVFQPYRPEPPSIITSRNNTTMKSKERWWFPPLYISPASLKLISQNEKEKINTPMGIIESYKFRFKNGKIFPDVLEKTLLISNKLESTLWYDASTGVLLKEETKTDKGDIYKFTINKTNINLSVIGTHK